MLTCAGFFHSPAAGFMALLCTAVFGAVFFVFTRARYRRIAKLTEKIDLVLHNAERLPFSNADDSEGELAVIESELNKLTLRIREQNDALRHEKERLADSLADVSHQLRTPLTTATLILTLLNDAPDPRERMRLLREMKELFAEMDWLVSTLLKLSRLDAGIAVFLREPIDVSALLAAAVKPFAIMTELHGVDLSLDAPDGIWMTGDPNWLTEAIQNIVKNCIESAGDGGRIAIAALDNALYTEITIRDNGRGFAPGELPRVFERFYRGKSKSAAGYGIGLALARTLIVRQGGTVTAKNHPDGGAVFTIRFSK